MFSFFYFHSFRAVDHQWDGDVFATAGAQLDIWNHNRFHLNIFQILLPQYGKWISFQHILFLSSRSQPVNSFEWGKDTTISVRFNPGEPNILATSARSASYMKPILIIIPVGGLTMSAAKY